MMILSDWFVQMFQETGPHVTKKGKIMLTMES